MALDLLQKEILMSIRRQIDMFEFADLIDSYDKEKFEEILQAVEKEYN